MIVAAFRREEVSDDHPLRLVRPPVHLVLSPFDAESTRRLLQSMAGTVPDELVDAVVRISGGNPFGASAVLRGMIERGVLSQTATGWHFHGDRLRAEPPGQDVSSFLVDRLRGLPDNTRAILSVAAVLGREFDLESAASLSGIDLASAVALLNEARRRNLVCARRGEETYAFVHDKIRAAFLDLIPPEERMRLHREAGLRLANASPERAFDMAYHFDAAGDHQRALPHALVGASQARSRHALEVAERNYRIARRGAANGDADLRQRIAEDLGDVLMLRGCYDLAAEELKTARELAATSVVKSRVALKVGELAYKRGRVEESIEALESALRHLGKSVPRRKAAFVGFLLLEMIVQIFHTLAPRLFLARRPA
ncbi:MAG TPA: hypothetical protein VI565_06020, partial [Burkholderiales bacterium]|nr:hypothetical protein [Burkholderiales bacterium]